MSRSLNLLIAATLIGSAPLPALAQAWPSAVVASAPRLTTPSRVPALNLQRDVTAFQPSNRALTPTERPAIKMNPIAEPGDIPDVEVRPKAEWTDDQGLRVSPTRLAYKSRF